MQSVMGGTCMGVEQLMLVLPADTGEGQAALSVHRWSALVDQFAAMGGRHLILGGPEPLAFGGFWVMARRAFRGRVPRVSAYLSGNLLEPWVVRQLAGSGVHAMLALDSLQPEPHEALRGGSSHTRAMAALDTLLTHGMAGRVSLLSTATRLNAEEIPTLAAWAASKGVTSLAVITVPDGGWPSPQLKALRISPEEKSALYRELEQSARLIGGSFHAGPLDPSDDPDWSATPGLLRVMPSGEAYWGLAGDAPRLGNLARLSLDTLLERTTQAAGD